MHIDIYFIILLAISSAIAFAISFSSRKIQYYGIETDNQIMVRVASESNTWRWLSDMHKKEYKSLMKDATIFFIAIMQRILRDKKSDHTYVVLNCISNIVSTICIYGIGKFLWEPKIAFIIGLLFVSSILIWTMTIYVGHTTVSTALFLISLLFLLYMKDAMFLMLIASGILFGLNAMASPSSRKYILLYLAALGFSKHHTLLLAGEYKQILEALSKNFHFTINAILIALFILGIIIIKLSYKKIIKLIYNQKLHARLNAIIVSREKFSLDHYIKHANKKLNILLKKIISIAFFIFISMHVIGFGYLAPVGLGFCFIFLVFMLPNIKNNLKGYISYYYEGHVKNRFRVYPMYFAKMNIPLPFPVKRPGWKWTYKYFFYMLPVQSWIFFLSAVGVLFIAYNSQYPFQESIIWLLVFLSALLPLLWGELTRGVQLGRSYLPVLVGSFAFTGFAFNIFYTKNKYTFYLGIFISIIAFIHLFKKFIFDAFPSRMSSLYLVKKLHSLGIKEFYTYKNNYNNGFVHCIDPEILSRYSIHYINTLSEVHDGWIVIPGTSSKAMNMESELETIIHGDFTVDPILNKLLHTKEIEKIAEEKFKTFGTSKVWVHEAEITSYRDLILHEISDNDRYRAHAWLLHSSKLKNI